MVSIILNIILALIIIYIVLNILAYLFPAIIVDGYSMLPTYNNTDFLISTRIFSKKKLKEGDIVLFTSPSARKPAVKRIYTIEKIDGILHFFLLGDNTEHSTDSRDYGLVPESLIITKVIAHIKNPRKD